MTRPGTDPWITPPTQAATPDDLERIRDAIHDYYEGWYDADPERMRRALHADLAKRSWAQDRARTPAVSSLSAGQMIVWTAAGHGRQDGLGGRDLEIDIVDVSHPIASVVVRAPAYDEYFHLVETPDGWRIVNVLWRYADGHGPTS